MFNFQEVEKLYPGAGELMLEPQFIHKGTDAQLKNCDDGTWFAELKKDGALYMYVKGTEGQDYLFGRTVSKKTGLLTEKSANVPHIIRAFKDIPYGTIILGEIYYPGKTSKDVTSIMGCLPAKAIERQKGAYGPIHYYIYDCLEYGGISLLPYDNWSRYCVTQAIYGKVIDKCDAIELAAAVDEEIYATIGVALESGEEGMVVKKKTALYEPGKRPQTMLKAKQVDFIDAVIMGFTDPVMEYTGKELESWQYWKDVESDEIWSPPSCLYTSDYRERGLMSVPKHCYYGWKNAIIIGAYDSQGKLKEIGTIASGLTDELRQAFAKEPEKYLGKVVKIQCMMKDNKEQTLRHGFWQGLHDEKNPEDCTLESIFK